MFKLSWFFLIDVFNRGITGSGKSFSSSLLVNQFLRLSTHSKREAKLAEQIKALGSVLDAFGNAKTVMNANASRHGRYLELHFNDRGRISSAKILTYGLDKTRLTRLSHKERTYHVFYQLPLMVTHVVRQYGDNWLDTVCQLSWHGNDNIVRHSADNYCQTMYW